MIQCNNLSFLSENFRVLCKYKAKMTIRALEGTIQEGSIPILMEVVFVTTVLVKKFPNIFLERLILTKTNLIGEKRFLKKILNNKSINRRHYETNKTTKPLKFGRHYAYM